jgi:hypothetical protein
MKDADVINALMRINLATPNEIYDFLNRTLMGDHTIQVIGHILTKKNIKYYMFNERYAPRRYVLNYKKDNRFPQPRICFDWPDIANEAVVKKALKFKTNEIIINNNKSLELCPDPDRPIIFCVSQGTCLDGVIDFRRMSHNRIRFPTIVYSMAGRDGTSEWIRACDIYSKPGKNKYLRIRGTDI